MSENASLIADLVDALPQRDQELTLDFVKKLIRAWDPDFTKVTPDEAKRMREAEESGFVSSDEIDWDAIGI